MTTHYAKRTDGRIEIFNDTKGNSTLVIGNGTIELDCEDTYYNETYNIKEYHIARMLRDMLDDMLKQLRPHVKDLEEGLKDNNFLGNAWSWGEEEYEITLSDLDRYEKAYVQFTVATSSRHATIDELPNNRMRVRVKREQGDAEL